MTSEHILHSACGCGRQDRRQWNTPLRAMRQMQPLGAYHHQRPTPPTPTTPPAIIPPKDIPQQIQLDIVFHSSFRDGCHQLHHHISMTGVSCSPPVGSKTCVLLNEYQALLISSFRVGYVCTSVGFTRDRSHRPEGPSSRAMKRDQEGKSEQ